jgi:hypothetical protein
MGGAVVVAWRVLTVLVVHPGVVYWNAVSLKRYERTALKDPLRQAIEKAMVRSAPPACGVVARAGALAVAAFVCLMLILISDVSLILVLVSVLLMYC